VGAPLSAWRRRHQLAFLWCAWNVIAFVGLVLASLVGIGISALWSLLASFALAPDRSFYDLTLAGVLALGLSVPQYVVLRAFAGFKGGAVAAWIPLSVLIFVAEELIGLLWFHDTSGAVSTFIDIIFWAALALAQGLLLAEMIHRRSAAFLWMAGMGAVFVTGWTLGVIGLGRMDLGDNIVVAFLIGAVMLTVIYSGITGIFLAVAVRVSTQTAPQAPVSTGPAPAAGGLQ